MSGSAVRLVALLALWLLALGSSSLAQPSPWPMFRGGPQRLGSTSYRIPSQRPSVRWRYSTERPIYASPAVARDGTVYADSLDGSVLSLSAAGRLRWRYASGSQIFASPALTRDGIVVGTDADHLLLLDAATGQPRWSQQLGPCPVQMGVSLEGVRCDADSSALLAADGMLYLGGDALYAYAQGGQRKATSSPRPR